MRRLLSVTALASCYLADCLPVLAQQRERVAAKVVIENPQPVAERVFAIFNDVAGIALVTFLVTGSIWLYQRWTGKPRKPLFTLSEELMAPVEVASSGATGPSAKPAGDDSEENAGAEVEADEEASNKS